MSQSRRLLGGTAGRPTTGPLATDGHRPPQSYLKGSSAIGQRQRTAPRGDCAGDRSPRPGTRPIDVRPRIKAPPQSIRLSVRTHPTSG